MLSLFTSPKAMNLEIVRGMQGIWLLNLIGSNAY